MNLKDVLPTNENDIINYIERKKLNDNEIKEFKKMQNNSEKIQNAIKDHRKKWVKIFLENHKNITEEPNYILTGAYSKSKDKLKNKILDELILRHCNDKIKDSTFFTFIQKNQNIELLKKLNPEQREQYKEYLNFENLNNIQEFEDFYSLQTSGFFNFSLTTVLNFSKSFSLWDSEKEKIKECFYYYNPDVIPLILNKTSKEVAIELIESYIQKHTQDSSLLFILEGGESDYGKEKIKEEFKSKMIFLSKDLKLNQSLSLLDKYEIDLSIIDPHGDYKNKKIKI